ncbi:M20/M25/M40 family metallo-hydrolase [Actinophytocola sp.]|uniref:M20/M25/M40 family metallo-hydrolase n=1 Tax=Actinophytocola sp. TaxID=1872138 RepID=UPI003899C869
MRTVALLPEDHGLLLELLRLPTAGPLESATPPRLWEAQRRYAEAAHPLGFRVAHHAPCDPGAVDREDVPLPVRQAAASPDFLVMQPSLVLAAGRGPAIMFNVHLDTVAGDEPVDFDGSRFTGRGAIDAKGPAVALLAGVRAANAEDPALLDDVGMLVQVVSGEEGGAMGTIGTRPLVEAGFVGRLNVFCEPTGLRALSRVTAAMTARVSVHGQDAVDDAPEDGHNASVLLGFLAQHLACELSAVGRPCVAGLHTGTLHNRVYGTGSLLLNLPYADQERARVWARVVPAAVAAGLDAFAVRFRDVPALARTAADAHAVTRLEWLKQGLPTLTGADDPWAEGLLYEAGVSPWPPAEPGFTCDAIWLADVSGVSTVVIGPGTLAANNAHATGEFAELAELERFAATVARVLLAFARRARNGEV